MAVIDQPVEVSERCGAEALKAEALTWVNDLRAEYGAEPLAELPKGVPRMAARCVVSLALSALHDWSAPDPLRTSYFAMEFSRDGKIQDRPVPPEVCLFIYRFDRGGYPELIG